MTDYSITVHTDSVPFTGGGAIHSWAVIKNHLTGKVDLVSFQVGGSNILGPEQSFFDADSKLGDLNNRSTASFQYDISQQQYLDVIAETNRLKQSSLYGMMPYALIPDNNSHNCVTMMSRVLNVAGISDFDGIFNPMIIEDRILGLHINQTLEEFLSGVKQFADTYTYYLKNLGEISGAVSEYYRLAGTIIPKKDPLALDLNGDGISSISADDGIIFDHNASGVKTGTGWVNSNDGWLVLDRDGNGEIDSGRELFGDNTRKLDGNLATDAFDAIASFDTNGDGKVDINDATGDLDGNSTIDAINSNGDAESYWDINNNGQYDAGIDKGFNDLKVWVDADSDGVTDAGELQDLSSHGIVSIGVNGTADGSVDANGNEIAATGTYEKDTDGDGVADETHSTTAFNLEENPFFREFEGTIIVDSDVQDLPNMRGSGALRDLAESASIDSAEGLSLKTLLNDFATATTRTAQFALMDELLMKWAATSDFEDFVERMDGTSDDRVEYRFGYHAKMQDIHGEWIASPEMTYDLSDFYVGSAAFEDHPDQAMLEEIAKVRVLEVFNNRLFFDFFREAEIDDSDPQAVEFDLSLTVTAGSGGSRTKTYTSGGGGGGGVGTVTWPLVLPISEEDFPPSNSSFIHGAYDQLRESVYQSLVLQTRLKPYLDEIDLSITESGEVAFDFTGYDEAVDDAITADAVEGAADLIDLLRYMGSNLAESGWDAEGAWEKLAQTLDGMSTAEHESLADSGFNVLYDIDNVADLQNTTGVDRVQNVLARLSDNDVGNGAFDFGWLGVGAVVVGGAETDRVNGSHGNDVFYGAGGNDALSGARGDDALWGGEGDDNLDGQDGDDALFGGSGNDDLNGGVGDDYLSGGAGNDLFWNTAGDNVIDGGAGDDFTYIDQGQEAGDTTTILFGFGDGHDELYGGSYSEDKRVVIQLKSGVSEEDVRIRRDGKRMWFELLDEAGAVTDSIEVPSAWHSSTVSSFNKHVSMISAVVFADGTVWEEEQINLASQKGRDLAGGGTAFSDKLYGFDEGSTIVDLDGDDVIYGRGGDDIVIAGKGNDNFYGHTSGSHSVSQRGGLDEYWFGYGDGNDNVWFEDSVTDHRKVIVLKEDVTDLSRVEIKHDGAWDLTISLLDGNGSVVDKVTVKYAFLSNSADYDWLKGATAIRFAGLGGMEIDRAQLATLARDEVLDLSSAFAQDDHIIVQSANAIEDSSASETFDFSAYSDALRGNDFDPDGDLSDQTVTGALSGTVDFANENGDSFDYTLTGSGGSTTATVNVDVVGYDDTIEGTNQRDIVFANSDNGATVNTYGGDDLIFGSSGDDTINAHAGNDVIVGGGGNDTLDGGRGENTFRFGVGDGNDTIVNSNDSDVLEFAAGIDPDDVYIEREGDDYIVRIQGNHNDTVRIAGTSGLNTIAFVDSPATSWPLDPAVLLRDDLGFTIDVSASDSSGTTDGYFIRAEHLLNNDSLGTGDWVLVGAELEGYYQGDGSSAGTFNLFGGALFHENFYGEDTIIVPLHSDSTHVVIKYLIQDANGGPVHAATTTVHFSSGVLVGSDGIDFLDGVDALSTTLDGRGGNDRIHGGKGDDTVLHRTGDGNDELTMWEGSNANDTLVLMGNGSTTASDVTFQQDGKDLLVKLHGETLTVRNYFHSSGLGILQGYIGSILLFADEAAYNAYQTDPVANAANLLGDWTPHGANGTTAVKSVDSQLVTTSGDDVINTIGYNTEIQVNGLADTVDGQAGDDVIRTNDMDDSLTGGEGDDFLVGGSGSDTYHYSIGDGSDRIENSDADAASTDEDVLAITGDSSINDYRELWLTYGDADGQDDGDDLIVSFVGRTEQIVLEDFAVQGADDKLDKIAFTHNGNTWELSNDQFDALITAMSNYGSAPTDGWYNSIGSGSAEETLDNALTTAWTVV